MPQPKYVTYAGLWGLITIKVICGESVHTEYLFFQNYAPLK